MIYMWAYLWAYLGDQLNSTCRTITNKMRYDAMNGYWIYMDTYGWPDALVRRSRQPGTTNTVQIISQLVYQMCINYQKFFHCKIHSDSDMTDFGFCLDL